MYIYMYIYKNVSVHYTDYNYSLRKIVALFLVGYTV